VSHSSSNSSSFPSVRQVMKPIVIALWWAVTSHRRTTDGVEQTNIVSDSSVIVESGVHPVEFWSARQVARSYSRIKFYTKVFMILYWLHVATASSCPFTGQLFSSKKLHLR
jgi:hypothetical protein